MKTVSRRLIGMWLALSFVLCLSVSIPAQAGMKAAIRVEAIISSEWDEPVPSEWSMEYVPLLGEEAAIAKQLVKRALSRYSQQILKNVCRKAIVTESLTYQHTSIAGFCNDGVIFISYNAGNESELEKSVHHELAHLFMDKFTMKFPKNEWMYSNPAGFTYKGDPLAAIEADRAGSDANDPKFPDGSLDRYSTTALNEDFCTIIENVFVPSPELIERMKASDRFSHKVNLAIEFYKSIGLELKSPLEKKPEDSHSAPASPGDFYHLFGIQSGNREMRFKDQHD